MLLTFAGSLAAGAALGLVGCTSPSPASDAGKDAEPCAAGFLGDPTATPELEIEVLLADNTVAPIKDGDSVPMLLPPQGGRIIFAGVRASNIDACALQLTGALRDLGTGAVMDEMRTVNLTPAGDGWGASATSETTISEAIPSFANIPACPNNWSSTDLYGHPFGLEVSILDRGKRQLAMTVQVTPECAQPENAPECLCICKAGYVTGQACSDAGSDP